jgi:tRNA 2-selenouridine synthase
LSLERVNNFKEIVIKDIPLIDVRAPIEFKKGAFKNAINLPLMNNKERELVGIRYKNNGNEAALKLGYKLVSNSIKKSRVDAWINFIKQNPNAVMYCFRGGQRSEISQKWLEEVGIKIPRINGGYKAFRTYLIDILDNANTLFKPIRVAGKTGSGKTTLLKEFNNFIDLEGLANHRGSAFGSFILPQPTQINFENNLAYEVIKKSQTFKTILFEDESRHIGKNYIPNNFFNFLSKSKIVLLEIDINSRIENIFNDYIVNEISSYQNFYKDNGLKLWQDKMLKDFMNIQKKLGYENYKKIIEIFNNAKDNISLHKEWIELLLVQYYDPMYNYQLRNKESSILFKGNQKELLEFLKNMI